MIKERGNKQVSQDNLLDKEYSMDLSKTKIHKCPQSDYLNVIFSP